MYGIFTSLIFPKTAQFGVRVIDGISVKFMIEFNPIGWIGTTSNFTAISENVFFIPLTFHESPSISQFGATVNQLAPATSVIFWAFSPLQSIVQFPPPGLNNIYSRSYFVYTL